MPKFITFRSALVNLDLVERIHPADGGTAVDIYFAKDYCIHLQMSYAEVRQAIEAWQEGAEERQVMVLREALFNGRGNLQVEVLE